MIVDGVLIPQVRGERTQPIAGPPLTMAHDIGDHEHLRQRIPKTLDRKIDAGLLGTARKQWLKAGEPAHVGNTRILRRARPAAHLPLEQTGEGKDKRLGRLVGGIIVDLRCSPIEKLIKAISLSGLQHSVGRQLLHDRQDYAVEEPTKIGLKDPW